MNWLQEHIETHPFTIIGHRGAAGLVPENTLASFERARVLGCRMIELDVHLAGSADDAELIVIHDFTLERTTSGTGRIDAQTAAALASYRTVDGEPIPTLSRVFAWAAASQIYINVELKAQGTGLALARFIASECYPDTRILVSSFDRRELRSFRTRNTATPLALLYDKWHPEWHRHAKEVDACAINLGNKITTAKRVAGLREAGFGVFVYTVNTRKRAERLQQIGVNGVFTDRPDRMLGLMR